MTPQHQGSAGGRGARRRGGGGGCRPDGAEGDEVGHPSQPSGGRGRGGGNIRGPGLKQGKDNSPKEAAMHHHPPKDMAAAVGYPMRGGQTLLIAYFPWEASEADIEAEFSKFCRVKRVHLVVDKSSRKPRCFGFVKFMSKADAEEALRATTQGLVQLPDTRGHVWHLKAEWTRSGDMVVDDSETEQEVAKRKEERRSRGGERAADAGGLDGAGRAMPPRTYGKQPGGGATKGALHPGVPAPLPPLQPRYPASSPPAALGLQGQLPPTMMHSGQQLQQPLPPPLAQGPVVQHAHQGVSQQALYSGYPGGSAVQQGLPLYGGQPPAAGTYGGGASVPGAPVYSGLPGGGTSGVPSAGGPRELDAPGLGASASARDHAIATSTAHGATQSSSQGFSSQGSYHPSQPQGFAPAHGYPASTTQTGYALPQGYPAAQGYVPTGQPGYPPEQPYPGQQAYPSQPQAYSQQGYPPAPQAYSQQQGGSYGSPPPPGYPSQGYAPPGYPGSQPAPPYGGYGQPPQAVPVQPGVPPQSAGPQQGAYGYLPQPAAPTHSQHPGVVTYGSSYAGGTTASASASAQPTASSQDIGAIAIATVPTQPRHQDSVSGAMLGGAAPSSRNSDYLDMVWQVPDMPLHREAGATASGTLQPPPPSQQPPAPPAGCSVGAGAGQWKADAFRDVPAQADQRPGAGDWAVAARGVVASGTAGPSAWTGFDDAAAKGMVDGLVGGEDAGGGPPPAWR